MKYFKTHSEFLNEAKLSKIYNAAKKGSYPVSLVVVEDGKVVKQELVGTPQIVPAAFNQLKKEYPNAKISIESRTGETLFVESVAITTTILNNLLNDDEEDIEIEESTNNSKNHIGSTSDGQGSNAEIYKKGKGYYVVVSGEADYDFDAKNDKELLKKLKDNEFDSTDILEVNEAGDTIGGLNKMANTNLERIADYADMIKDRMSQGQTLDAWMYSKISDSVKNLNSVHDTMDGNDGVNEAKDSFYIKQLTDTFDKFKLPRKYEIMMDSLFGGGSKIAVLRKRNTYGGGAMIDTHRKDGGSNYEGFIEILSSRSGRPIPGKSKFDNIDDAMKAATKFVDGIKESVNEAKFN